MVSSVVNIRNINLRNVSRMSLKEFQFVRLVGFYGISTFVGYLMPNPFLYKYTVLFRTIKLSISTQFNCQKNSISSYSVLSNSSISNDSV